MAKRKRTKRETIVDKKLHRKQKISITSDLDKLLRMVVWYILTSFSFVVWGYETFYRWVMFISYICLLLMKLIFKYMYINQAKTMFIPLHGFKMQLSVWTSSPLQYSPPLSGSGLEQDRLRWRVPFPQLTEHSVQLFQSVHPPSTECVSICINMYISGMWTYFLACKNPF